MGGISNTYWIIQFGFLVVHRVVLFSDFSLNFPKRVSAFGGAVTAEESIAL